MVATENSPALQGVERFIQRMGDGDTRAGHRQHIHHVFLLPRRLVAASLEFEEMRRGAMDDADMSGTPATTPMDFMMPPIRAELFTPFGTQNANTPGNARARMWANT